MTNKKFSIVVPVYFNAGSLPRLFEELRKVEEQLKERSVALELIFVDDGSRDDSLDKLLTFKRARPETVVAKLTRNFGAVHCSKTGIKFVTGDAFMVLAADLGSRETKWEQADPALVGADLIAGFVPTDAAAGRYATKGVVRPSNLDFVPFYRQYNRRSAVYFKHFSEAAWKVEEAAYNAEQARLRDIAARSVDVMHLGEMQPERDHSLTSEMSWPVTYRGRQGRDVRSGGFLEFDMAVKPGPLMLQASYWGDERGRTFDILIDNTKVATQKLDHDAPGKFFDVEYAVPEALTRGKQKVRVRIVPKDRSTAGPIFGVRLFTAKPAATN